jgi:WD40 repeat protein
MPATELKGHTALVYALAFDPAGKRLATAGFDRTLRLWDAAAGKELKKIGLPDDPYGLALAPDGRRVAVAGYAGHLTVWAWGVAKPAVTAKDKAPVGCVGFTPAGQTLVSGHDDGRVRITPLA